MFRCRNALLQNSCYTRHSLKDNTPTTPLRHLTVSNFFILTVGTLLAFLCQLTRYTFFLTYWSRVMHICIGKLTIIGSDNGLLPGLRLAIIWTNVGILLIGPLETNFSEIPIEIQTFSMKKTCLKMLSAKCCPFCLGLNVFCYTCWYSCTMKLTT